MIPRECKRLAEVDFPIAEVSKSVSQHSADIKRYFFAFVSASLNAFSISPRATIASFHTSGKQSSA